MPLAQSHRQTFDGSRLWLKVPIHAYVLHVVRIGLNMIKTTPTVPIQEPLFCQEPQSSHMPKVASFLGSTRLMLLVLRAVRMKGNQSWRGHLPNLHFRWPRQLKNHQCPHQHHLVLNLMLRLILIHQWFLGLPTPVTSPPTLTCRVKFQLLELLRLRCLPPAAAGRSGTSYTSGSLDWD